MKRQPAEPGVMPMTSFPSIGVKEHFEALIREITSGEGGVGYDGSFWSEISPLVEQDRVSTAGTFDVLASVHDPARNRLLDFGCGTSNYRASLEAVGWDWTGVDYLDFVAPQAAEAVARQSDKVFLYDGRVLPFAESSFDVVFSFLVFEHIQHIDVTFSEIARVLAPGGHLVGMVSYLEPTHDFSTFNFTPIGLKVASERNGLRLRAVYPAYDVFSFLLTRLAGAFVHPSETVFGDMFNDGGNVVHQSIAEAGRRRNLSFAQINMLKLQFSAFITFDIVKPDQT